MRCTRDILCSQPEHLISRQIRARTVRDEPAWAGDRRHSVFWLVTLTPLSLSQSAAPRARPPRAPRQDPGRVAALSVLGLFTVARSPQTLAPPGAPLERPRSAASWPRAAAACAAARAVATRSSRTCQAAEREAANTKRSLKKVNISNKSENALCCQLRRAPAVIRRVLLTYLPVLTRVYPSRRSN